MFILSMTLCGQVGAPAFHDYPVAERFDERPAEPILATSEQRRYQTRIREGVSKGRGVWNGSWKDAVETKGPNFAGHYFVIRWGCGSNCLMMAVVDGASGKVHGPPLGAQGESLEMSMDPMSDVEIEFRRDSSLMVLRNGCAKARADCGVFYFKWQDDRFTLIRRDLVDLTREK